MVWSIADANVNVNTEAVLEGGKFSGHLVQTGVWCLHVEIFVHICSNCLTLVRVVVNLRNTEIKVGEFILDGTRRAHTYLETICYSKKY